MLKHLLSFAFFVAASTGLPAQQVQAGLQEGRVLWLRGDLGLTRGISDLVNEWRDVGGEHHSVFSMSAVAMPQWRAAAVNGHPALHFDGNDCLFGLGMPGRSYTNVVVCQLDDLAGINSVLSNFSRHGLYFGGDDRARLFHGTDIVTSTTGVQVDTPIILVATYDAKSGTGVLYQDGVLVGSGSDHFRRNGDSAILLGSFGFDSFFSGSIAEVMAYDRVLGGSDLQSLHDYLLRRYRGDAAPIVQFDQTPQSGQLFQRDGQDSAVVEFAGTVRSEAWSNLTLEVTRDGLPYESVHQTLGFENGSAPFSFHSTLYAGKYDYAFSLYATNASEQRLVTSVGNVAVGDVWLINGQSNAVAADYHNEQLANAECQSHWVRSFGTSTRESDARFDQHWDLADGEDIYEHCTVGAWALRFGSLLEQRHSMPIGLINGAVGGSSISEHQRDDAEPMNLSTIYGRLLYRVSAAGVQHGVRGVLWYQGEGDSEFATFWRTEWQRLRQSWQFDYPTMNQAYLFQIRDNCLGEGGPVREVQRELIDTSNDTYVMSTTAAPQHDGCHFHYPGYRELGDRLARVVGRDVYGSSDVQEIDPPNIQSARWNNAEHSQVLLTFRDADDKLVFDAGAETNFFLDDDLAIVGAMVKCNTVVLQLAGPSTATAINHAGRSSDGPCLKNARGVGALAFFDVVIE